MTITDPKAKFQHIVAILLKNMFMTLAAGSCFECLTRQSGGSMITNYLLLTPPKGDERKPVTVEGTNHDGLVKNFFENF